MSIDYSTHAEVLVSKGHPKSAQATVVFITAEPKKLSGDDALLPATVRAAAKSAIAVSSAKAGEASLLLADGTHRVLVVGLGAEAKLNSEEVRKAGGAIYRTARRQKLTDVAVSLPKVPGMSAAMVAEALATGAVLASFEFRTYVGTRRKKDYADRKDVRLHVIGDGAAIKGAVERATVVGRSCNFARTIASRPGNDINPVTLAAVAKNLAGAVGLKYSVVDDKQMRKLSMGGLLGVGGGSPTPPRLIALEHKPKGAKNAGKPLLVVGKSITFDTGGISIKPAERMQKMIYDKCGGMAVLGLMHALAMLEIPVHVVGVLTAAENHVSGNSYRPGDVLTMHNGITVEITNTDAEGRLVLGDAISWGIATYKPAAVVDLATLTGGCVVALGTTMAGIFSNNDALAAEITAAGSGEGEKMWRLPVGDEQREMLKSELADVVNSAGRYASPLTGAAFVSLFVPADNSVPWVHLDIAGVADSDKDLPYLGRGATAFGVRTLLRWVESRA